MPGEGPHAESQVALLGDASIVELLKTSRRIAVVGASSNPDRPSFGVFRTLVAAGYECIPVNPNETEVWGVPAVATLTEAAAARLNLKIAEVPIVYVDREHGASKISRRIVLEALLETTGIGARRLVGR